jgi:hypothetical protein
MKNIKPKQNIECKCGKNWKYHWDNNGCAIKKDSPKVELPEWWEKRFDEKMKNWKFHHKTTPCLKDDYALNEIKQFFRHSTTQLVEKIKGEVEGLKLDNHNGVYHEVDQWNDALSSAIKIISKYK